MAKAYNGYRDKEFSGFNRLLQEICERFLQDYNAFNVANSEKKMSRSFGLKKYEEHFKLFKDWLTMAPVLTLPSGDKKVYSVL